MEGVIWNSTDDLRHFTVESSEGLGIIQKNYSILHPIVFIIDWKKKNVYNCEEREAEIV